ncbi:hypothetical protein [Paenibacillus brasilensis]|nr:hypothetical protein [Paenibacillus brasilensis]
MLGEKVHNFIIAGTNSEFFDIKGNLSANKETVEYNGLSLQDCLHI